MKNKTEGSERKYMNPYLAGFLLGLVIIFAFYFTGRGLGASGAIKSAVVATVDVVAHNHAMDSEYFKPYASKEESPLQAWLVFEIIGVMIGALLSGVVAGRLKLKIEHSPKITSKTRLIMAVIGGILFGIGSQLGRGCTSGAALSGMSVLSTTGFISMIAIFGTGYVFAYFFRKFWI
ncbi:MAG: YeeE/YedE family protein [Bacteroidales bacterium]|nr:YeeE/YedE family protein [Bacteroidales bacterium]